MNSPPQLLLVYDGECPACRAYCQLLNIRHSLGELRLVDARENSEVMDEITARGMDIDEGMVLKVEDQFYYGADAIHALALMGSRSSLFNRVNYWMFRSKTSATILYPVLRSCRNLLLKILGKTRINNLQLHDNDRF